MIAITIISSFILVILFVGLIKIIAQLDELIRLLKAKNKTETQLVDAIEALKDNS